MIINGKVKREVRRKEKRDKDEEISHTVSHSSLCISLLLFALYSVVKRSRHRPNILLCPSHKDQWWLLYISSIPPEKRILLQSGLHLPNFR
jgi:hypothetical protein